MIYELYIFNRHCSCVYHTQWNKVPGSVTVGGPEAGGTANASRATELVNSPSFLSTGNSQEKFNQQSEKRNDSDFSAERGKVQATNQEPSALAFEEQAKLVYGVVFSLRNMVDKLTVKQLDPANESALTAPPFSTTSSLQGMLSFRTNRYKLHYFETASNLKFILMTDRNLDTLAAREVLKYIYEKVYVETVSKNALAKFDSPITNSLFTTTLNAYMLSVPGFNKS